MKKNASAVASVSDVPTIDQKTLKDSIDRLKEQFHVAQGDYLRRTGTTFDIGIVNYPSKKVKPKDWEQITRAAFTFSTCQWVQLITPDGFRMEAEERQDNGTVDLKIWGKLISDADRLMQLMPSGSSSGFVSLLFAMAAESPTTLYPSNVTRYVWNGRSAVKAFSVGNVPLDRDLMLIVHDAHAAAGALINSLWPDVTNDAGVVAATKKSKAGKELTTHDIEHGRETWKSIPTRKKTVQSFRDAFRAAGHSKSDTMLGLLFRMIKEEQN